jgi:acetyltransferase-like isoleucine patch superfamily enzyme
VKPLRSLARFWRRRAGPRLASSLRLLRLRIANLGEDVEFGSGTRLGPGFRLRLAPGGRVKVGRRVYFREGVTLDVGSDAVVEIGDDCDFTFGTVIQISKSLKIGSGCLVGTHVSISDTWHEVPEPRPPNAQTPLVNWPIEIGQGVMVSNQAMVTKSVGYGSIIGANSFVSEPIPDRVFAAGNPAVIKRHFR